MNYSLSARPGLLARVGTVVSPESTRGWAVALSRRLKNDATFRLAAVSVQRRVHCRRHRLFVEHASKKCLRLARCARLGGQGCVIHLQDANAIALIGEPLKHLLNLTRVDCLELYIGQCRSGESFPV